MMYTSVRKCFKGTCVSCGARFFMLPGQLRWLLRRDERSLKPMWTKTTSGQKSLQVTSTWMELMIDCVVRVASKRISRDGRHLRGRCQSRRAGSDGSGPGRGGRPCETAALRTPRNLSDAGAAPELVDDRTRDVAFIPATSDPEVSQGAS